MSTLDWKRKLAAYLHDPPSKCLDIRTHGERSDAAFRQAGFTDETEIGEYFAHADHTSAAADRLPFPWWQSSRLSCAMPEAVAKRTPPGFKIRYKVAITVRKS